MKRSKFLVKGQPVSLLFFCVLLSATFFQESLSKLLPQPFPSQTINIPGYQRVQDIYQPHTEVPFKDFEAKSDAGAPFVTPSPQRTWATDNGNGYQAPPAGGLPLYNSVPGMASSDPESLLPYQIDKQITGIDEYRHGRGSRGVEMFPVSQMQIDNTDADPIALIMSQKPGQQRQAAAYSQEPRPSSTEPPREFSREEQEFSRESQDRKSEPEPLNREREELPRERERQEFPRQKKRKEFPRNREHEEFPRERERQELPREREREEFPRDRERQEFSKKSQEVSKKSQQNSQEAPGFSRERQEPEEIAREPEAREPPQFSQELSGVARRRQGGSRGHQEIERNPETRDSLSESQSFLREPQEFRHNPRRLSHRRSWREPQEFPRGPPELPREPQEPISGPREFSQDPQNPYRDIKGFSRERQDPYRDIKEMPREPQDPYRDRKEFSREPQDLIPPPAAPPSPEFSSKSQDVPPEPEEFPQQRLQKPEGYSPEPNFFPPEEPPRQQQQYGRRQYANDMMINYGMMYPTPQLDDERLYGMSPEDRGRRSFGRRPRPRTVNRFEDDFHDNMAGAPPQYESPDDSNSKSYPPQNTPNNDAPQNQQNQMKKRHRSRHSNQQRPYENSNANPRRASFGPYGYMDQDFDDNLLQELEQEQEEEPVESNYFYERSGNLRDVQDEPRKAPISVPVVRKQDNNNKDEDEQFDREKGSRRGPSRKSSDATANMDATALEEEIVLGNVRRQKDTRNQQEPRELLPRDLKQDGEEDGAEGKTMRKQNDENNAGGANAQNTDERQQTGRNTGRQGETTFRVPHPQRDRTNPPNRDRTVLPPAAKNEDNFLMKLDEEQVGPAISRRRFDPGESSRYNLEPVESGMDGAYGMNELNRRRRSSPSISRYDYGYEEDDGNSAYPIIAPVAVPIPTKYMYHGEPLYTYEFPSLVYDHNRRRRQGEGPVQLMLNRHRRRNPQRRVIRRVIRRLPSKRKQKRLKKKVERQPEQHTTSTSTSAPNPAIKENTEEEEEDDEKNDIEPQTTISPSSVTTTEATTTIGDDSTSSTVSSTTDATTTPSASSTTDSSPSSESVDSTTEEIDTNGSSTTTLATATEDATTVQPTSRKSSKRKKKHSKNV